MKRKFCEVCGEEFFVKLTSGGNGKRLSRFLNQRFCSGKCSRPAKQINIIGRRYGRLLVISFSHREGTRYYWRCTCDCGKETTTERSGLFSGSSQSCGCLRNELRTTHGMGKTKFYHVFYGIKERCNNPKSYAYKHYGGRGIKCEWESFEEFRNDMFNSYKKGLTIDRKNNEGNYSKDNCHWVTYKVNCRNTRKTRFIEYKGEKLSVGEWADRIGVTPGVIFGRIDRYGWSIDKALTTMVR